MTHLDEADWTAVKKDWFKLFVLVNYKTKERYLCSFDENLPPLFGQKIHYIGITNGLGGFRSMLSKGFVVRKFQKLLTMEQAAYKRFAETLEKKYFNSDDWLVKINTLERIEKLFKKIEGI